MASVITLNYKTTINLTPQENSLITWAVNELQKKFLAAGGKESEMAKKEAIEWFFIGLLCREGEKAVKSFVNEWKYKATKRRLIGYC